MFSLFIYKPLEFRSVRCLENSSVFAIYFQNSNSFIFRIVNWLTSREFFTFEVILPPYDKCLLLFMSAESFPLIEYWWNWMSNRLTEHRTLSKLIPFRMKWSIWWFMSQSPIHRYLSFFTLNNFSEGKVLFMQTGASAMFEKKNEQKFYPRSFSWRKKNLLAL